MTQITRAATAYEIWYGQRLKKADRQALMDAAGVEIIDTSGLNWCTYEAETDNTTLPTRLGRERASARTLWPF